MSFLTRWQKPDGSNSALPAFGRLFDLRDDLDRLFSGPLGEVAAAGSHFLRNGSPALDVYEDKDNVFVKAEVPGMKKEGINVSLEDGVLSISGERKKEETHADAESHRTELFVGQFHRSVTLPTEVKSNQVNANYQDGVLTITLPKAEEAKKKHIEVKVS
jgi:HSP20 family protein